MSAAHVYTRPASSLDFVYLDGNHTFDYIMQDPNTMLYPIIKQLKVITVNDQTFFDFIRWQSPLVFVVLLFAGSGMICNDVRNNLTEIYFSKPLNWRGH